MPRPLYNRYLDNFGIPEDHPIWRHWEVEAARAGRKSVKRYVLDLLLDRDAKLWGNGAGPEVTPQDLWFPGGTALVRLEDLPTLLAGVTPVLGQPAQEGLVINEDDIAANAQDLTSVWDD